VPELTPPRSLTLLPLLLLLLLLPLLLLLLLPFLRPLPDATAACRYYRAVAAAAIAWQAHSKADLDVPELTLPRNLLLHLCCRCRCCCFAAASAAIVAATAAVVAVAACRYRCLPLLCAAAVSWQAHSKADLDVPELTSPHNLLLLSLLLRCCLTPPQAHTHAHTHTTIHKEAELDVPVLTSHSHTHTHTHVHTHITPRLHTYTPLLLLLLTLLLLL
jgi:hypothetical protein